MLLMAMDLPKSTLMDTQHGEHYLINKIIDDHHELLETDDSLILSDDDKNKLKDDGLKKNLCCHGLSHYAGKKAEMVERLKKTMVEKVPLLNTH